MIIWRLVDGKKGHENQTAGLLDALKRRSSVESFDLPCTHTKSLPSRIASLIEQGLSLPPPDLILGAGHATHLPLLQARHLFGGRCMVMMKPSLPLRFFDLCAIPQHDGVHSTLRPVVITQGPIHRVLPSPNKTAQRGTILIGGPSRVYGWDSGSLCRQLETVLATQPDIRWSATTSRRTPLEALSPLEELFSRFPQADLVPHHETDPDWVPRQLQASGHVCVTLDSMSMVFEALTSGAVTTGLDLPCRIKRHRLTREVARLQEEGFLHTMASWNQGKFPPHAKPFPCEADRCARLVLEQMHAWAPQPALPARVFEASLA